MYYLSYIFIMAISLISPSTHAVNSALDSPVALSLKTSKSCQSVQNGAFSILKNYGDANFADDLIAYSKITSLDNECYRWQAIILDNLRNLSLEPIGYRDHMFDLISAIDADFKSELMLHLFRYSIALKPLSDKEWDAVKDSLQVSSEITVLSVMLGLVASPNIEDADLQVKMADLFEMAKGKNLAAPELIDLSRAIELFLTITIEQRPALFADYYNTYFYLLDNSGMKNITEYAIVFFNDNQNEIGLAFIETFIGNVSVEEGIDKSLFSLLYKMHKEKEFSDFYHHAITVLVKNNPDQIRNIILNAKLNNTKKDLLIIEYQLNEPGEYSVGDYAEQLFDEQIRKQQKAAEYLLAFGSRSEVVKEDVINKLMSLQVSKDKISSTNLIVTLLKVLDNVGSEDQQTISIFLWGLEDTDPRISLQAKAGLESIGASAMPEYNKSFKTYSLKVQASVIEIMGSFDRSKVTAIKFLSRVTPKNEKMKFAINDAVAELNAF